MHGEASGYSGRSSEIRDAGHQRGLQVGSLCAVDVPASQGLVEAAAVSCASASVVTEGLVCRKYASQTIVAERELQAKAPRPPEMLISA